MRSWTQDRCSCSCSSSWVRSSALSVNAARLADDNQPSDDDDRGRARPREGCPVPRQGSRDEQARGAATESRRAADCRGACCSRKWLVGRCADPQLLGGAAGWRAGHSATTWSANSRRGKVEQCRRRLHCRITLGGQPPNAAATTRLANEAGSSGEQQFDDCERTNELNSPHFPGKVPRGWATVGTSLLEPALTEKYQAKTNAAAITEPRPARTGSSRGGAAWRRKREHGPKRKGDTHDQGHLLPMPGRTASRAGPPGAITDWEHVANGVEELADPEGVPEAASRRRHARHIGARRRHRTNSVRSNGTWSTHIQIDWARSPPQPLVNRRRGRPWP